MPRPTGITVLAVIHFVIAALLLLSGALWLWLVSVLKSGAGVGMEAPQGLPLNLSDEILWLFRMGPWAGALFLLYGVLKAVSGYGLLTLRNWGRRLTIGLAGLTILLSLPGSVSSLLARQPLEMALNLVFAGCYALIIWYLFTPRVKQAFRAR